MSVKCGKCGAVCANLMALILHTKIDHPRPKRPKKPKGK